MRMSGFHHIRVAASGMLLLAGMTAVCPQAAHGSQTHDEAPVEAPAAPRHDADGHDHDSCEYEVVHSHNIRLSCAPDEIASNLLAAYGHEGEQPYGTVAVRASIRHSRDRDRAPGGSPALLGTVRLLL